MKIQCDVCERAPATVICCADEAALCAKCDVEVHAANKLASKHQRLLLHSLSSKLPKCDICQDKPAFIFCVEDRALFCEDCDEPIHAPNTLAANHQRLLATGIQVALTAAANATACSGGPSVDPPASKPAPPNPISASATSPWSVDDLLHFTDHFDSASDKQQKEALDQLGEFEWLADMGMLGDHVPEEAMAAAEVPQLQGNHFTSNRPPKSVAPSFKKPRIESPVDEDEFFIVPDLG